jgi:2-amino-4-hydroxy-6-hydroxymethyldihydropteridine diphosphokinase
VLETAPWGPVTSQPDFLNLVARGSSGGQASDLLRLAHEAEAAACRARTVRGGPRTLDVDLIFFGDLQIHSPSLQLPHPHWEERPFVHQLIPEVAGDMVDPETGRLLRELAGVDPLAKNMRLVAPVPWMKASQGPPLF